MIAVDARFITKSLDGMGRYTLNLLEGIRRLGPAERILLLAGEQTCLPKSIAECSSFRRVHVKVARPGLIDQVFLPPLLRREGVDLFFTSDALAPMYSGCRTVITLHDVIPLACRKHLWASRKAQMAPLWKAWLQAQCRAAEAVVTVSHHSAEDIHRLLGVPRNKLRVIYNGVGIESGPLVSSGVMERFGLDAPFILCVGRCDPYKNLPMLVKAYFLARARLAGPLRLVIAGHRDARYPEAEEEAARLQLGADVVFTGVLDERDLCRLYRAASLLAFPSLYEGFGLPPLEAMSLGVPVVASNRTSVPEVCGDAALLADPLDAQAFAGAMVRVLANPEVAADLRRRGSARAAHFTPERQAQQTLAVCQDVRASGLAKGLLPS